MNNRLRNILCSTLLLTLPMASLAKEKAENDSVCRPLFTAFEINLGGASWVDKPLSYFTFSGLSFSVNLEMMRAAKGNSKWIRQHQFRYMYNKGAMAISGNGGSKANFGNYTFGIMRQSTVCPNLRLYYGPNLDVLGGKVENDHGGNNPVTYKIDISVGFTGMAVYDFKLGKRPVTVTYQMAIPIFSAFTQTKQGYFTTSLFDGFRVGTWGSHFNMRNRLHADIHFNSWALRIGYNNDIITHYATPNHFQYVSHNFVLGFTGELMRWSKSNENKRIKTALYTY